MHFLFNAQECDRRAAWDENSLAASCARFRNQLNQHFAFCQRKSLELCALRDSAASHFYPRGIPSPQQISQFSIWQCSKCARWDSCRGCIFYTYSAGAPFRILYRFVRVLTSDSSFAPGTEYQTRKGEWNADWVAYLSRENADETLAHFYADWTFGIVRQSFIYFLKTFRFLDICIFWRWK